MKEGVIYKIRRLESKYPNVLDIEGDSLNYAQIGKMHGGQFNMHGDDPRHDMIIRRCKEIVRLFLEIEKLNTK